MSLGCHRSRATPTRWIRDVLKCKIAIVGGGLAGLATAQALARFGMEAHVFEATSALKEVGAAVGTSPQANKALRAIGLGKKIDSIGDHFQGLYTRNMQTGEFLEFRDPKDIEKQYGAPSYTFHRADLLDALADGIAPASIHLGSPADQYRRARGIGLN